jgi:hypothetical protein
MTERENDFYVGQHVAVTGDEDGKEFYKEPGVIVNTELHSMKLVRFDDWCEGHGEGAREWWVSRELVTPVLVVTTKKKRPHGKQEYKGNGKHEWEDVTSGTRRLRVPGGWLYSHALYGVPAIAFVPVPEVVGYAV